MSSLLGAHVCRALSHRAGNRGARSRIGPSQEVTPKIRATSIFAVILLILVAPTAGCTSEEYDDAYYAKVLTVTLLPKETKDPKATPPAPPYYRLQAARGFMGGGSLVSQTTFAEFRALYPGMERFTPNMRKVWYPDTGGKGLDAMRIFVRFSNRNSVDIVAGFVHRMENGVKEGHFLVIRPSTELLSKISGIRHFRDQKNQNYDRYVYFQSDGRTVAVECLYEHLCGGFSTWRNKLEVEYFFNRARVLEMSEIDLAVNRLIESFSPTLIKERE